eukprot:TRINITY_DN22541_c0_g1_i1.p1 TRINITY_DN22541_c0_g1~~TRINITY_DN22541_c0_g1_i1.p1  ORF type:complete len:505 (+),score=79.44 TRINITY_DN22541_c0_g1_i1:80-1594(+)
MLRAWYLLGLQLPAVLSQIYHFENAPVAESKSLSVSYVYFVFSKQEAEDKSAGEAYVKFHNLVVKSSAPDRPDDTLKDYQGVQLSIMRYLDFWSQVDRSRMCSTPDDVKQGLSHTTDHLIIRRDFGESFADAHVYRHQLRFGQTTSDEQKVVTKSGVYVLVLSNCGSFDQATISGTVIVRNPHGYLPANEFPKIKFFLRLGAFYCAIGVVWALLCWRWRTELLKFHKCIAAVIVLGIIECGLTYMFLQDWNSDGIRSKLLFGLALFFSITRTTTSYMLVLVACLGWGVTRPMLDNATSCYISVLSVAYIALNFVREIVITFRHTNSLPLYFVMLCLLPVSLMNGGIFYWVFSALQTLMETLEARGQSQKLRIFEKLKWILIVSIFFAVATLVVQVLYFAKNAAQYWRDQWLITDMAPNAVFAFVLVAIMVLWAPHSDSQRYAYSTQIDGNEESGIGAQAGTEAADRSVWLDEKDGIEGDDSFWSSTKKGPDELKGPVDVIGANG